MKILILSATKSEILPFLDSHEWQHVSESLYRVHAYGHFIDVLISYPGVYYTIFALTRCISENTYDLVLNVGIAGAFDEYIRLGDLVTVVSEQIADLGVNDRGKFLSLFELNLLDSDQKPFTKGCIYPLQTILNSRIDALKHVNGLTVNTVSGEIGEICRLKNTYNADVETMEGAAVFFVCSSMNVQSYQIRAISNYVEERQKENWKIGLAIENLNSEIIAVIQAFKKKLS